MSDDWRTIDINDPSYRRAASAIWLVAGVVALVLSVRYTNPWLLTIGVILMGGAGLMFTRRHYRLAKCLVYLMAGVLYAWVWTLSGWRGLFTCLVSGLLVGLLFTVVLRKRAG